MSGSTIGTTTAAGIAADQGHHRYLKAWQKLDEVMKRVCKERCRRFRLQESDAEDIAQRVAAEIFQKIKEFNRRIQSFQAWSSVIAAHLLCNLIRDRKRQGGNQGVGGTDALEQIDQLQDPVAMSQEIASDLGNVFETHARVLRIVDKMADSNSIRVKRYTVFLRDINNEIRPGEASKELGMTFSAYSTAKGRFLETLKKLMSGTTV